MYLRSLSDFPGVSKTASVDLAHIVPNDSDGDERWVLSISTTAYSDNVLRTSIQNSYCNFLKQGFAKSSGFVTSPYTITVSTNDQLTVTIDGVTADVILTPGINLSGSAVAADIETQLRALAEEGGSQEGNLSFLTANCYYNDGVFMITSGSLSELYTGATRTSVEIPSSGTAVATLGFDRPVQSVDLAGRVIRESYLATSYTVSGTSVILNSTSQMEANRAYAITDGTNTDYFVASAVISGSNTLTVADTAITNNYTDGTATKIQMLVISDPNAEPKSPIDDVDYAVRHLIMTTQRQIDFSS